MGFPTPTTSVICPQRRASRRRQLARRTLSLALLPHTRLRTSLESYPNTMSSAAQQSSAAQANLGDHHTPTHIETVPSSTSTTGAGTGIGSGAGLESTPSSSHETHSQSHSASSTGGAQTGHQVEGHNMQSEAAAGLGSDPWEGKELPSQKAKDADIAAHEGAAAGGDQEIGEDGYPVQRHAGSVGLGPNYKKHPNVADKIGGTAEEIKGKILRKPEVVEHGHDRKTGALEEKKKAEDAAEDPFKKEEDATDSAPKDTPHPAKSAVTEDKPSDHSQGFTGTSQKTTGSAGAPGAAGTQNVQTSRAL